VSFRKALGPASAVTDGEARIFGTGERRRSFSSDRQKSQTPPTAMAAAFLRALVRLAGAHQSKIKITIPTGTADIGETKLVLCAFGLIRDRRAPQ
jgi:hypothetical protein